MNFYEQLTSDLGYSPGDSLTPIMPQFAGKEVEILANGNEHNYGTVGTRFTISPNYRVIPGRPIRTGSCIDMLRDFPNGEIGNSIRLTDFKIINLEESKDVIIERIAEKAKIVDKGNKELSLLRKKLAFLQKTKNTSFKKKDFLTYYIKNLLDDKDLETDEKVEEIIFASKA